MRITKTLPLLIFVIACTANTTHAQTNAQDLERISKILENERRASVLVSEMNRMWSVDMDPDPMMQKVFAEQPRRIQRIEQLQAAIETLKENGQGASALSEAAKREIRAILEPNIANYENLLKNPRVLQDAARVASLDQLLADQTAALQAINAPAIQLNTPSTPCRTIPLTAVQPRTPWTLDMVLKENPLLSDTRIREAMNNTLTNPNPNLRPGIATGDFPPASVEIRPGQFTELPTPNNQPFKALSEQVAAAKQAALAPETALARVNRLSKRINRWANWIFGVHVAIDSVKGGFLTYEEIARRITALERITNNSTNKAVYSSTAEWKNLLKEIESLKKEKAELDKEDAEQLKKMTPEEINDLYLRQAGVI